MNGSTASKWWMVLSGLALIGVGVLAYLDTTIIDRQWVGSSPDAVLRFDAMLGPMLAAAGLISIGFALVLSGRARAAAALLLGLVFLAGFALFMARPDLMGRLDVPVNDGVHIWHLTLAALSLGAGLVAWAATAHHERPPRIVHGAPLRR